ncbi:DNA ligase D [Aliihoeflea sp. PC F10.4]
MAALETYRKKRDFKKTPEPSGSARKKKSGNSFVVQKHDATRLHYDFRIEVDGVLMSWAVTRGPSLVPGEKRLAVHVEDHPLDYGDFEGTIPKGEYGGGTVIVWDRGTWKPVYDFQKGLKKGHIEFELEGEKLTGRWHLVRLARKPREKRDNWLLIKADDDYARGEDDPDILEERPESVKTGRMIADVENEAPGWSSKTGKIEPDTPAPQPAKMKKAKKAGFPGFIEPQLATLKPTAPDGARWLHEIKFDGYRLQVHVRGRKVTMLTRSGLDWTEKFGDAVPEAFGKLPLKDAIIDGELVVEGNGGASDFSALQADLSEGRADRFAFYAFDVLYLDGMDLRATPLIERKTALEGLLADAPPTLRYSAHFEEDGEMILRHACRLSLEGVVSKVRDAAYKSGRGRDWVKSKCSERQEFVIGGYVPSSTSKKAIGSLLLGYHDGKKLVHAGRVGTGFSRRVAEDLFRQLSALETGKLPFDGTLSAEAKRGAHFVEPKLVAEVEFRAWTADGNVRHASFRGLREDKKASEIVREGGKTAKAEDKPKSAVKLTHPDRVYWKDAGVTKEGLADYYSRVWTYMAPFVVNRPLALLRCPTGTAGQCFFQKHAWKGQSKEILTVHEKLDDSEEPGIAIDDLDGLIGLVQGGTLEIHPWGASLADIEKPDMIIMDLDPGDGVSWDRVIEAAHEVRKRLEAAGLTGFVKTSGGKGLHVVAPVKPKADWDTVKAFTKQIADDMATDAPDDYVATITKSKRKGKILIDYLRNGRGMTAVAPYSTRARDGATVSMPLSWDELSPEIGPDHFTVANALARLDNLDTDPWADFRKKEAVIGGAKTKK